MSIPGFAALGVAVLTLAGCAAGRSARVTASASTSSPAACTDTVSGTLRSVARNIYAQAAGGRNVYAAEKRLARSPALAAAVERGDSAATTAALRPLLKAQIHRIVITRGNRVLASVGRVAALAPSRGVIRDAGGRAVGRYAMSISTDAGIAGITRQVTGDQVVIRAGARQLASTLPRGSRVVPHDGTVTFDGVPYSVSSYGGTGFPSGSLRVWLLRPVSTPATCAASASATTADTIGAVAQRLYRDEASGPSTQRVLRYVASYGPLVQAVERDDAAALRSAIVALFRVHSLHVVRIRATTATGQLVNDVGGPYVLAPATTTLRAPGGSVIGRVTLSVQDDTGYIKLVHRFTDADVVLRTPAGAVPGSFPAVGAPAFAFHATAFPVGDLQVSLILPTTPAVSSTHGAIRRLRRGGDRVVSGPRARQHARLLHRDARHV